MVSPGVPGASRQYVVCFPAISNHEMDLSEMEELWQRVKMQHRKEKT